MWQVVLGLFFSINVARGQEANFQSEAQEYRRQVEHLNERYEDFFAHDERQRRFEEKIKSGIPEVKGERQDHRDQRERARLQQVATRQAKPDLTALEQEDDRQRQAQALIQDKHRRDFVIQREQLEKISGSARKIPENRDAGLE